MKRIILIIVMVFVLLAALITGGVVYFYHQAKWAVEKATNSSMTYVDVIGTENQNLGIGFTETDSFLQFQTYYYLIPSGRIVWRIKGSDLLIPYSGETEE